jgi:hypothetical protein
VIVEWIVAVEPAVVVLRQDRNIRKGRQSWAEVVETMLLQRQLIESNWTTICLLCAECARSVAARAELEVEARWSRCLSMPMSTVR